MPALVLRRAASHPEPLADPRPSDHHVPLVQAPEGEPTVAVVVATQPGPGLRPLDRRRLGQRLRSAERRVRGVAPEVRQRLRDQLDRLAAVADGAPVGEGLALVASTVEGTVVHLRHPVRTRVLVGPAPSRLDLAEATGAPERLALLVLTLDRARLLVSDRGVLRDVVDGGLPVRRVGPVEGGALLPQYLDDVAAAVATGLPERSPLVVAGDERLVAAFVDRHAEVPVVAALPGDHRATAPLTLAGLARRHLQRTLTLPQRRALAEVAVAAADGRLTVGAASAERGAARARRPLLVLERGMRHRHPTTVDTAVRLVEERGGRVVVVPEGRLLEFDGIALVRDAVDVGAGVAS